MFDLIGKVANAALQPVRDAIDALDGLTEGEIRVKAAARLGTDVVAGMALSEVIKELEND